MKKLILLLASMLFLSCGGDQRAVKENIETNPFDGVYKRVGTIQYVKGIPVDTVYISDLEEKEKFRQMKIFLDGYINWFTDSEIPENFKDRKTPWKSGQGGFGPYNFYNKDGQSKLVEKLTNLAGNGMLWANGSMRDSIIENGFRYFRFNVNQESDGYTQVFDWDEAPETGYGEYFQKVELDNSNASELDGVWKHIANVTYINNIPVDTIAVPDGLDDHKTFLKGHAVVNFDFTKAKEGDDNWGGSALYGTYSYVDGVLTENWMMGTGNWIENGTKWDPLVADIDMIDEDSFIQINRYNADEEKKQRNGLLHVRVK